MSPIRGDDDRYAVVSSGNIRPTASVGRMEPEVTRSVCAGT